MNRCPRCLGAIPNNAQPGAYPGALSRVDNVTEVCSACGTEEALEQFMHDGMMVPMSMWPIKDAVLRRNFPEPA